MPLVSASPWELPPPGAFPRSPGGEGRGRQPGTSALLLKSLAGAFLLGHLDGLAEGRGQACPWKVALGLTARRHSLPSLLAASLFSQRPRLQAVLLSVSTARGRPGGPCASCHPWSSSWPPPLRFSFLGSPGTRSGWGGGGQRGSCRHRASAGPIPPA